METPKSLCIAYLFNPMSFLTAIMQKTARDKGLPLDNVCLFYFILFLFLNLNLNFSFEFEFEFEFEFIYNN